MRTEVIQLTTNENVTLTTYLLDSTQDMPNTSQRPAIMILPGGGYTHLSNREAEPIAMAFLAEGYHAFVLRYSIQENAVFPKPLNDAEEALDLIRQNADQWGVNPDQIAVCGFSAGGHLAALLGTTGRVRPNALILGYPVILEKFIKPGVDNEVDELTPPAFIFATANDTRVLVQNSIALATALDHAEIPFELHIFQEGVHGLSLAKPHTSRGAKSMVNPAFAIWSALCFTWLKNLFGDFAVEDDDMG